MGKSMPVTNALQDYLEAILILSQDTQKEVRVTDIASHLDIAKASVTQALRLLKKQGLIKQDHYGPVTLTVKGRQYAMKIQYRHQVLRLFLTQLLGVAEQIAEEDACRMEHVISSETFERLLDFLEKQNKDIYNRRQFFHTIEKKSEIKED